jgi:hypothetical protein
MDPEKVKIVADTLEIDNESAEMALKLADGNLDKAFKMDHYVDKRYAIIQGKFNYGGYNKFYGLFILIIDGKNGKTIKTELIVNRDTEYNDISLRVDSNVFIKTINGLENSNSRQSSNLRLMLDNEFNPAKLFEILAKAKDNDFNGIKQIIKAKLEKELEEEIELRLRSKVKTETQLKRVHPDFFDGVDEEQEEEDTTGSNKLGINITLNCIPIVSPTFGKKITELDIGSQLLIKVIDQREVGQYLNNLLSSDVGAVVGTIEGIEFKEKSERYSVLIKLSSNVYGKIYIESEVKLATPESEQEKMARLKTAQETGNRLINKDMVPIVLLIGLVIILLIIILKLYL